MRLDSLTSLRFFAAFIVFGYHANVLLGSQSREITQVLFGGGAAGVDFFFLLSGALLAWSYREHDTAGKFYRRRAARIYPAYLVTLGIGAVLVLLSSPERLSDGWATPILLQAWLPSPENVLALNVPAWSLSVEAFFYLLFPLLIGAVFRANSTTRYVTAAILFAVVILISAPSVTHFVQSTTGYHLAYFPPARLPEFIIGMLVGAQLKTKGVPRIPIAIPAIASVLVVLWAGWIDNTWGTIALPLIPFVLLIVACAQRDLAKEPSLLERKSLQSLGVWSYCFYLVHVLVLTVVHSGLERFTMDEVADGWVAWVLTLGLSLVGAYALHRWVEKPFDRLLRGNQRPPVLAEV